MDKLVKLLLVLVAISLTGCEDFLDAKPQKSLVIPNSLDDFQAILDAEPRYLNSAGSLALLGSDDMVLGPSLLTIMSPEERAVYFWEKEVYSQNDLVIDWTLNYQMIYYANLVLDGLKDFKPRNETERLRALELQGAAMFSRAFGHFSLMQVFAAPYDPEQTSLAAIPIRTSADLNLATGLSNTAEVYELIISDLDFASANLPDKQEILTRASKWSAEALLSRVYLVMQKYDEVFEHAGIALSIGNQLMNFNTLSSGNSYTFPRFNTEIIHQVNVVSTRITFNKEQFVHPALYDLYDSLDLRKTVLFDTARTAGYVNLVSRYSGDFYDFGGLAVDEVLLNRAEAAARIGEEDIALQDVNRLLSNRYIKNSFEELELSGSELMKRILAERRKELLFRGIRWMDLRRLNQDPVYAITLNRSYNESDATLLPKGSGYTIPIPPNEISLNPKLD
ncbi:SusD-like starch-binding protein associating with outer membrane [Algoriphagus ratkowskyi]|uniref:RagB/SusD family nutrient uptake outer membrane protein n=1 Tax=Algoriphagus ratkowskyi TaxID=57028 RepID=A0A2W7S371_9BACT|nr:RagB/SusD family nutrient uptake outer membrane protein [Algoriphagus ratkowskyi]PZX57605.1 SusD-like starch-binding protein associating with outer membrane [Algoriphagus ratkowskyi]TXD78879.1 RagB/SusD family nutrient uptake outer membrane protein [Algoriphagus ratkowskyi]